MLLGVETGGGLSVCGCWGVGGACWVPVGAVPGLPGWRTMFGGLWGGCWGPWGLLLLLVLGGVTAGLMATGGDAEDDALLLWSLFVEEESITESMLIVHALLQNKKITLRTFQSLLTDCTLAHSQHHGHL